MPRDLACSAPSEASSTALMSNKDDSSVNLADFVEYKFIPEHVITKRAASQSYFHAILKYILTPERVARAFGIDPGEAANKLEPLPDWPYLDNMALSDLSPEIIQSVISASLVRGYSPRTATHIRDVIRAVLSHAALCGYYLGANPARLVTVPAVIRKETHTLSLEQLRQVVHLMRFPEKCIALFVLLTDMNVSEICGLQWKYVNLSNGGRPVDSEWLSPRNIAIRNQSYRGDFGPVVTRRRRLISVPDFLYGVLRELKNREKFTSGEDFVITSRTGTPISPGNISLRRLKFIGKTLDLPWLSWKVFHQTRVSMERQFGRYFNREIEQALQITRR
jgi:integrase